MFIPLYDTNPVERIKLQWVTISIIALNVVVYLVVNWGAAAIEGGTHYFILALGHVPSVSNDLRTLPDGYGLIPDGIYVTTTITSAFLHADFWHLAGNMLFIWVFGDNVEDALGHFRFLVFYILCAMGAAMFHAFAFYQSDAPLIGASGAAAGIVAAYLMLHPKTKVWVLFLSRIPVLLPAYVLLGGWLAFQVFMFVTDSNGVVSWASHVGGALVGLVLVVLMKRRDVPLFDRQVRLPKAAQTVPGTRDLPQERWGRQ